MEYARVIAVTANIESLSGKPEKFRPWLNSIVAEIVEQKPHFVALHLQGLAPVPRNADEEDSVSAQRIYKKISENAEIKDHFESCHAFMDTEFDSSNFTGLGSIFLIKDSITAEIWDCKKNSFGFVSDRGVFEDKLSKNNAVIKDVFPDQMNPNKRERKQKGSPNGFLVSKWKLFDKVMVFVNLQLFSNDDIPLHNAKECHHEASLVRLDQVQFLSKRVKDLEGEFGEEAAVWAGAFNAKLDQEKLLRDLSDTHRAVSQERNDEKGDLQALDFFTIDGKKLMTLENNRFDLYGTHDWFFGLCNGQMAKKYNKEITRDAFEGILREAPIFFPPTSAYCFDKKEDKDSFLRSVCPSWSDRILFNPKFAEMTKFDSFSCSGEYYGLIGRNQDIGEHKPVSLHVTACVKGKK